MEIKSYNIETSCGVISECFGHPLGFLSKEERTALNLIGFTGKNKNGEETSRVKYLNSLNYGTFTINQTLFDNGDFSERFIITRVVDDVTEIIKERDRLIEALRRIESVYDWQDDLAGKIAHEALKDVKH